MSIEIDFLTSVCCARKKKRAKKVPSHSNMKTER